MNTFRCDYCGKFISFAALQDGTANRVFKLRYDWLREDVIEEYDTYHEACRSLSRERIEAAMKRVRHETNTQHMY